MALVFNELFEGTGYQNSWTESVGAGCTINEDALSSAVGSPNGWGVQCLNLVTAASVDNYTYSQYGDAAVRYSRTDVHFTAWSLADGDTKRILTFTNNSLATSTINIVLYRDGAQYYIYFGPVYDGVTQDYSFGAAVSLDTTYRLETKWDTTADLFSCKINGISLGGRALTAGRVQQGSVVVGFTYEAGTFTCYYDLVSVDDSTWVGPPAVVTGTATESIAEADIVTGGKTIVITLVGDTWIA